MSLFSGIKKLIPCSKILNSAHTIIFKLFALRYYYLDTILITNAGHCSINENKVSQ